MRPQLRLIILFSFLLLLASAGDTDDHPSLQQNQLSEDQHVWPEMELNWRIVVGTIIGFFGAAFGSVGGVGGGGLFVPMLTLIMGFDPKSATALSKCMIMGAAASTVYFNLKLRHPTLDLPIVDYDLVVLIQPVLLLGISIGVTLNVIFPNWVVPVLLIVLLLGTSLKAYMKGLDTWTKENIFREEAAKQYRLIPEGPSSGIHQSKPREVSVIENIYWKEFGLLVFVWVSYLALQISKNHTDTCSTSYWVLNLLQVPVSVGVFLYEAIGLYTGKRRIGSKGDEGANLRAHQLAAFCGCGILAGIVGGLLGLGGGFVMAPLFLELGIPPHDTFLYALDVTSATATFGMAFSSSMSVVEYYLLNRFPVPSAVYFIVVAFFAALVGQYMINKVVEITGRASMIIFVLAFTIFISALSLGGFGISNMVGKIERGEYMGLESLCNYVG